MEQSTWKSSACTSLLVVQRLE
uniref:Uncharacterized protein n=1 Tax=Arundo donax TaxID=35708 RepID=A0A0A8YCM8_ARUDO